jgi:hypothetical protein
MCSLRKRRGRRVLANILGRKGEFSELLKFSIKSEIRRRAGGKIILIFSGTVKQKKWEGTGCTKEISI